MGTQYGFLGGWGWEGGYLNLVVHITIGECKGLNSGNKYQLELI